MTTLAESVGRENIPEPAAKLQKLSPPPEPPLLVKKLSEHATIPTRGSAKAAGYDLSRCGTADGHHGSQGCADRCKRSALSLITSMLPIDTDRRATWQGMLSDCKTSPTLSATALTG